MSSPIIPVVRYQNAPLLIDWLCANFGFVKQTVYPGENNTILHAQLTLGTGMIMVSSVLDTPFSKYMKQPADVGGCETQCCFIYVTYADAVYEKGQKNGGKILLPIKDQDYGGRDFTCADPEGHIWSVGTYNPWQS